jgi:hypothetical protein
MLPAARLYNRANPVSTLRPERLTMPPTKLLNLLVFLAALATPAAAPAAPPAGAVDSALTVRFARLALDCVHREYPNKIAHVLNSRQRSCTRSSTAVSTGIPPSTATGCWCGCCAPHPPARCRRSYVRK